MVASAKRGVRGTLSEAADDSDDEDDDVRTLTKGAGLFFSSIATPPLAVLLAKGPEVTLTIRHASGCI